MNWRHANDERLASTCGDAGALLARAETADMLGLWPDGTLLRVRGEDGRAAWLWRATDGNGVMCCAVAPWDDVWTCDTVDGAAWFATPAGPDWLTKARLGASKQDWQSKHDRRLAPWPGGAVWAVGMIPVDGKPKARQALLCKVARVEDGRLVEVFTEDGGLPVPVSSLGASRWIPQDKFPEGYAALWTMGTTLAGSYMWHVIRAKRAAGLQAGGRAGRATR